MSARNFAKTSREFRMRKNGVEPAGGPVSKDALRRQADALLAAYSGPVKRLPAGTADAAPVHKAKAPAPVKAAKKWKTSKSKAQRMQQLGTAVPPGLVVYCDGCCIPNPGVGGWAFVVYRDGVEIDYRFGGEDATTNNVMELHGALMALQWIAANAAGERVRLFCDSMYVVQGCNDWRHAWKRKGWRRGSANTTDENATIANLGLWQLLDAALVDRPLVLEWCKGHAGIVGNERADGLSLEGRADALEANERDLWAAPDRTTDLLHQQLTYTI